MIARPKTLATTAACLLSIGVGSPRALACDRHIYNNSNQPWSFQFSNKLNWGHTDLNNCGSYKGGRCILNPHTAVDIVYWPGWEGATDGTVSITDSKGVTRDFEFDASPTTQFSDLCPSVEHSGGTGAVSVNEPARGDFSVGDDGW